MLSLQQMGKLKSEKLRGCIVMYPLKKENKDYHLRDAKTLALFPVECSLQFIVTL